jgi:hypothetical protein
VTQSTAIVRSDDGYEQAKEAVRDLVCGDCGSALVVLFMNGDGWAAKCPKDQAHPNRISHRQVEQDEIRQRMERNPGVSRELAMQGSRVPLTSQAIRELDNEKLLARVPARYGGTIDVTRAQRTQLAQLARIYGLDPLWDLMIYEGRPYVTYEGRLRKLREAPLYRGHKVRPLTRAEKEDWGYAPEDLVIQCDVDMGDHGTATDWGIVRASEVEAALKRAREKGRQAAPVATHPQQIAIKRAVSRASRQAAGVDLPTIIEASAAHVIEVEPMQRPRPTGSVEELARRRFWAIAQGSPPDGLGLGNDEIHQLLNVQSLNGYPGGWDQALSDLTMRVAESQAEDGDLPEFEDDDDIEDRSEAPQERQAGTEATAPVSVPGPVSDDLRAVLARNAELVGTARDMGCRGLGSLTANDSWPLGNIEKANAELEARIKSRNSEIDQKSAREAGQAGF